MVYYMTMHMYTDPSTWREFDREFMDSYDRFMKRVRTQYSAASTKKEENIADKVLRPLGQREDNLSISNTERCLEYVASNTSPTIKYKKNFSR